MTMTLTPRVGVPQWSAPTDSVSRIDFNNAFQAIEDKVAIDAQGLLSERPAFGIIGRYFYATDQGSLYRDNGTSWVSVGGVVENAIMTSTSPGTSAGVFRAAASQTADIVQVRSSGATVLSAFDLNGALKAGGTFVAGGGITSALRRDNAALSVNALTTGDPTVVVRAIASQAGSALQVQNNAGTVQASISPTGEASFGKATVTAAGGLTPSADGDLVPRKYLHDNFVTLASGSINNMLSIAAPSNAILRASTVGSNLSLVTSRLVAGDTTAMQFASNGALQVGGLTGSQAGAVPLTVMGSTGQSVSFLEVKSKAGETLSKIDQSGMFSSKALDVQMPTGWTQPALDIKNSGAISVFQVDRYGNIAARGLRAGSTADRIAALNTSNLNTGALWMDTTDKTAYFRDGSLWRPVAGRAFFLNDNPPTSGDGNDGDIWYEF